RRRASRALPVEVCILSSDETGPNGPNADPTEGEARAGAEGAPRRRRRGGRGRRRPGAKPAPDSQPATVQRESGRGEGEPAAPPRGRRRRGGRGRRRPSAPTGEAAAGEPSEAAVEESVLDEIAPPTPVAAPEPAVDEDDFGAFAAEPAAPAAAATAAGPRSG